MLKKNTSTDKYMRAAVLIFIHIILYFTYPNDLKSQQMPSFEKPFKLCRTYLNSSGTTQNLASDNNKNIIFTSDNNYIYSINPETNLENWKSQTSGKISPVINSDLENIYYLTSIENGSEERTFILNSISQKTGITNWQKKLGNFTNIKLHEASDENLIYLSAENHSILAINKTDGFTNWTKNLQPQIISVNTLSTNQINVLTEDSVIKIAKNNGEFLGEIRIRKNPTSNSISKKTYLLLGYSDGEFIKITADTKSSDFLWKIKAGGGISSITEIENKILFSSLDNFLYLYTTANGKLKWKRRVSGRINIKPLIYEKYAIVLSSSDNIASIIELDEGKVVNQIIIEDGNYFSGTPLILGKFIVFPTFRGIHLFINADLECK